MVEGALRYPSGALTSAGAKLVNPTGRNQWSTPRTTRALLQHRVDAAVLAKFTPECAQTLAEQVIDAMADINDPQKFRIVQAFLSAGILEGASLARPVDDLPEDEGSTTRELVADLASGFDVVLSEGERTALSAPTGIHEGAD